MIPKWLCNTKIYYVFPIQFRSFSTLERFKFLKPSIRQIIIFSFSLPKQFFSLIDHTYKSSNTIKGVVNIFFNSFYNTYLKL